MNADAERYIKLLKLKVPFTKDELNKSYKRNVKIWHPDINKHPRATEVLQTINAANDYLIKNFDSINQNFGQNPYSYRKAPPKYPKYKEPFYPAYDGKERPIIRDKEELKKPTLYRVLSSMPSEIIVPVEFLKSGGTIFVMIHGSEIKFNVPPNTTVAASTFMFGGESHRVIIKGTE